MNRFLASHAEEPVDTLDERTLVLFCRGARVALGLVLASLAASIGAELVAGPPWPTPQLALEVAQIPIVAVALASFATAARRYARGITLAVLVMNALALVPIGIARADAAAGPTLLTVATLGAAFILPWGAARQGAYATAAMVACWSLTLLLESPSAAALYPALARTALYVGSIVVAHLAEASRAERDRIEAALSEGTNSLIEANAELEEESRANAALLHVTATLQGHLRDADMLRRVNVLAIETLSCDWSATFLWDTRCGGLTLHATAGMPLDLAADLSRLVFPVALTAHEVLDSTQMTSPDGADHELMAILRRRGFQAYLCTPIRRDADVRGVLVHGYRATENTTTPRQRRIAVGMARATAMALENARLIGDLERASALKSEFVATMSHELRTPLNIVVGYGDMLLDGACGALEPAAIQALARIRQASGELLELVNATLDVNRLDAGQATVDVAGVDVAAVLAEVVAEVRDLRPDGVALRVSCDPPGAIVATDRAKLKTVARNLLGNACKFTAHGEIELTARAETDALEITVRDTGIGIAAEDQSIIFDMFRQVDGSMTRRFGGVGLGLHIVKRLVTLMGGTIVVASAPGAGSTFTVRLPTPAVAPAVAPLLATAS